jgi:hypothetical protein
MTLESDVAGVLRSDPATRISFKVADIAVNKAQIERVAKAIESGDIALKVDNSETPFMANYTSLTGAVFKPGERKLIGRMTLRNDNVVRTPLGKSTIYHESVHGLISMIGAKPDEHQDEAVAYLADALYLRAARISVSFPIAQTKTLYDAAFALVDGRKMLQKPGMTLQWKDCKALVDAVKRHPAYGGEPSHS